MPIIRLRSITVCPRWRQLRALLARLDVVMVSQASKGTSATFGGRRPEHDVYQLSTPYWHSAGQLYIPTVRFQLRS